MKYPAFILLVLFSYRVKSQDLKLAGVEYFNYPKVRIKEGQQNAQTSFQEFGAYANFPTVLKSRKTILVQGFFYGNVQSTLYNDIAGHQVKHDFHKIAYNFMLIHRWNEQWSFVGRLSPTLASDFEGPLNGQDFMMQGSLGIAKKVNERLLIGGGILYTTRLGKPMLLPSFQYRYQSGRHLLHAYFPALLNYSYQLDGREKLHVGLRATVNGANFNVTASRFNSNTAVDRLNYFRANTGPVLSYQLTRLLQIEATGGFSAFRRYQFEDTFGENYKYNSETGAFINIGLSISAAKKKEKVASIQP